MKVSIKFSLILKINKSRKTFWFGFLCNINFHVLLKLYWVETSFTGLIQINVPYRFFITSLPGWVHSLLNPVHLKNRATANQLERAVQYTHILNQGKRDGKPNEPAVSREIHVLLCRFEIIYFILGVWYQGLDCYRHLVRVRIKSLFFPCSYK